MMTGQRESVTRDTEADVSEIRKDLIAAWCADARDRKAGAPPVPQAGPEARRARRCFGLRRHRRRSVQKVLLAMSRWNDGVQAALSIRTGSRRSSRERDHPAVPVQRVLPRRRGAARRSADATSWSSAGSIREQEAVDARRALRAAAGLAGHAPHLRRGLERDRQVGRRALQRLPRSASAPTLTAKYVGFKCADDYYTSIDMPTALHPQTLLDVHVRRRDRCRRSTAFR